ncbi:unnamed protein product, partial [Ranitomeya imitator]
MAIHHLFQEPETDEKGLQSVFHQFRKRFWFSTLFFFRTTSRPGLQRKTRRGQWTRIRTTPDGDQVPGTDTTNNIVYNISSQCLSPTELNVLERGLSFCPVPRFNSFQRKGTAMGSNMAPPYANIFMDHFELTYVYTHPSFMSHVIYWRRYIDNVFLTWTKENKVGSLQVEKK